MKNDNGKMKNFMKNNWLKILCLIGGFVLFVEIFFTLFPYAFGGYYTFIDYFDIQWPWEHSNSQGINIK